MKANKNKIIGNNFEQELCKILFKNRFWAHNFAQKSSGQPCDIVCARNGKAYLIDCKVVSTEIGFQLSRIEDNQDSSMKLWKAFYGTSGWFAIKYENYDNEIYMLPHDFLDDIRLKKTTVKYHETGEFGLITLEEWLNAS